MPHRLAVKWCGGFHQTEIDHSPLDVVAWHGNYTPCCYDLSTFSPVGAIGFDPSFPVHYGIVKQVPAAQLAAAALFGLTLRADN